MKQRLEEIDFLRCVLILLMITFHIVYIGDTYAFAKQFVYTFHMPAFLLVSGYLCNTDKKMATFMKSMMWIFIPYLVMETAYVVMASLLPIREHIDNLTPMLLLDKIFLHPLGPYWYLHTWILCSMVCYFAMRLRAIKPMLRFLVAVAGCLLLGFCGLVSLPNALYFMTGAMISLLGMRFLAVFHPAWWAVLPVLSIAFFMPSQLDRATIGGMAIVFFMISFILYIYRFTSIRMRRPLLFVGRNTLLLLLFSPIFTAVSKLYQPLFLSFDPTGISFCIVTVTIATLGSLLIGHVSDLLRLSPFFFGKEKAVN